MSMNRCCRCGKFISEKTAFNPEPIWDSREYRCCSDCHADVVKPARQVLFEFLVSYGMRRGRIGRAACVLSDVVEMWMLEDDDDGELE